jgi:hypothetical protein
MANADDRKFLKNLIAELGRQGWVVDEKRRHYQARSSDGKHLVTFGKTLSDHRSRKNIIAEFRRRGFSWPT